MSRNMLSVISPHLTLHQTDLSDKARLSDVIIIKLSLIVVVTVNGYGATTQSVIKIILLSTQTHGPLFLPLTPEKKVNLEFKISLISLF